jgi:hypothetical protein
MGNELNFEVSYSDRVEYVANQLILAEGGDPSALNYMEYLIDRDPDLLIDAAKANEEELYYGLPS